MPTADEAQNTPIQPIAAAAVAPPPSPQPRSSGSTSAIVQQRPSPLQKQHRDVRSQPDYEPVQIIFLGGKHKGQMLDLGVSVEGILHSQSAEWETQEADGIRVGINFKRLSSREISLSLTFADLHEDISHLVENVALLHEIGDGEKQPPFVMLVQGSMRIAPCVCTTFNPQYDNPHPGRKGFRLVKSLELKFLLAGGKGSEHALGKPLTSTPLGDAAARQTQLERQRQGQQQVTRLLLADCLGEEGSDRLTELIDQGQLDNPRAIASLPPAAFVQGTIAGLFSAETLLDENLQNKLKQDLALVIAQNENGVGSQQAQGFANAMLTGNVSQLPNFLQEQASATQADFEQLLTSILAQDLGDESEVFAPGSTAGERLRSGFGSCGLSLRQSGAGSITSSDDVEMLNSINEFLSDATVTDEQVQARFELVNSSQVRLLRNGTPYQSKREFIQHVSQGTNGMNGYILWSRFSVLATPEEPPSDEPLDELDVSDNG
jgi:hypothetical protein